MKTIVQSQSVYSIGVVFNLAAYAAHSNLVLITNAILPQLIVRSTLSCPRCQPKLILEQRPGYIVHSNHHSYRTKRGFERHIRQPSDGRDYHRVQRPRPDAAATHCG